MFEALEREFLEALSLTREQAIVNTTKGTVHKMEIFILTVGLLLAFGAGVMAGLLLRATKTMSNVLGRIMR